jgi:hypothetical protein
LPKASSATAPDVVELDAAEILRLQHAVGNRAVVRLLRALRGGPDRGPDRAPGETACGTAYAGASGDGGRRDGRNGVARGGANPSRTRGAGLAFLRRVSAELRRAGDGPAADAIDGVARLLSRGGRAGQRRAPGPAVLREAVGLWARDTRQWGRPPLPARARACLVWLLTLGRSGAPWLDPAVPALARVPGWRRRDAAFVAEVAYRATGHALRRRPCRSQPGRWWPPRERDWARPEVPIDGFEAVDTPAPGDVWSDGRRAGVVLNVVGGRTLVLLPVWHAGEGGVCLAGLTLLLDVRGGEVRRRSAAV